MRVWKAILAVAVVAVLGACDGAMFRNADAAGASPAGGYNVANP